MAHIDESVEDADLQALLHPTTDLYRHRQSGPLVMSRGEGARIWDNRGNEYLEGMAGLWCNSLGHGNEELAKVAYDQVKTLSFAHLFQARSNEPAIHLAKKLADLVPLESAHFFFGNSGSDANDTQIKLVRYYNNLIGRPAKKKIISRLNAYHGVTIGAASLTGMKTFHTNFDVPIDGVLHTEYPHYYRYSEAGETESDYVARLAENLEKLIVNQGPETIAAFIAEPVMGAGGVLVPPRGYFPAIQNILNKYDILLIDDEVICGFGRTGEIFGAQAVDMTPNTMTFAKALSSGYAPISAVAIPGFMHEAFVEGGKTLGTFGHGFTYSGHPLGAAIALKTLEIYERDNVYEHARQVGEHMQARLTDLGAHPLVGEVRGIGMLGAVQIVQDKGRRTFYPVSDGVGQFCADRCLGRGLLTRAAGDALVICPPLTVTKGDIDEIFERLSAALADTLEWAHAHGIAPV